MRKAHHDEQCEAAPDGRDCEPAFQIRHVISFVWNLRTAKSKKRPQGIRYEMTCGRQCRDRLRCPKKESSTPNGIEDVSVKGRTPSWPCAIVGYTACSVNWNSLQYLSDFHGIYTFVGVGRRYCRNLVDC